MSEAAPKANPTEAEYTVDIAVIGGGAAGLTAANTALDEGKTVLLVEKMGITGGSGSKRREYLCRGNLSTEGQRH